MRPKKRPYREYLQVADYTIDWATNVRGWLEMNRRTLDSHIESVLVDFVKAGEPIECLEDIKLIKKIKSIDTITHHEAFILSHLYFWLD